MPFEVRVHALGGQAMGPGSVGFGHGQCENVKFFHTAR